jgi:hypothetical protein
VSKFPKSSEPAEKNDDVKLTNVREEPVFYITQVETVWQRRFFLFGSRWKAMMIADIHRFYVCPKTVGAGKIFAQLYQSCR